MKKALCTLAAVVALGAYASSASAQCDFNVPGKAKGLKSSFVKAYAACGGITYPEPNTSTMAEVPGCAPVIPLSAYTFDEESGGCSLKTKHKVESPCKTNPTTDCSNLSLGLKCSGILESDETSPVNGLGWVMNTVARATFSDNSSGDMTVIDFPAVFELPPFSGGSVKMKANTSDLLNQLFQEGSELPACTSIQLISVGIQDPAEAIFATLGTAGQ